MALQDNAWTRAQQEALRRLGAARQDFVRMVAPRLDDPTQRALYEKVMNDPALFDRVVKLYGAEGVERWRNAMAGKS